MRALQLLVEEKNLNSQEKANVLSQLSQQAIKNIESKKGKVTQQHDNEAMRLSLFSVITIMELKGYDFLRQIEEPFSSISKKVFNHCIPIAGYRNRITTDDLDEKYSQDLWEFPLSPCSDHFCRKNERKGRGLS